MGSRLVRCQSPGLLRQGIPCTQSFPRQHAASARLVPRRRHPRPPSWTCWPPASKKLATRRASGCIRCSRASSTSTWPARCSRDRSDAGAMKQWMHCCRFSRPHCRPGCRATVHREQTVGSPGRVEGQGTKAKDRRTLAPARLLGRCNGHVTCTGPGRPRGTSHAMRRGHAIHAACGVHVISTDLSATPWAHRRLRCPTRD